MTASAQYHSASFRDPAGRLFLAGGHLYRQVNQAGADDFNLLLESGLYDSLVKRAAIIPHEPADPALAVDPDIASAVIKPQLVPYLSWPYEWCFEQLQDAALLTLDIQLAALRKNMILKDASAYNIQFLAGRPVLIDTLSFTVYREGQAWFAYRQFCQHFLAPLALMSYVDARLVTLSRDFIDGVPLDLAVKLLPRRAFFRYGLFAHLYLHARSQQQHSDDGRTGQATGRTPNISRAALTALIGGLRNTVAGLRAPAASTEWENYYRETNYSDPGMEDKSRIVAQILGDLDDKPGKVLDLGANNGRFSRLAAGYADQVIAQDIDHNAIAMLYDQLKQEKQVNILPLVQDLANPAPAIGWAQQEREGLLQRGEVDVVMGLALIHHLAIGNNLPLPSIVSFFAALAPRAIIEFVPRGDSQVERMLATREDIFPDYHPAGFEAALAGVFDIVGKYPVRDSARVVYDLCRVDQGAGGSSSPA